MKWLKHKYILLFIFVVGVFFYPFFLQGKIPLPADSLVGLYHPWRDANSQEYPNGIPFKNPLITDPIRQQYPNRIEAITQLREKKFPWWNPYSFSGAPLFANIQTALLYPGNILFFIFSNTTAWSLLVFLQQVLAGIFLYYYLRNLRLDERACFLGALSFAFSGFCIAWLEWNTIVHVALWLPLILLAKDHLLKRFSLKWGVILVFAESAMILAGHIQTAFYLLLFTSIHLLAKAWYQEKTLLKTAFKLPPFVLTGLCVLLITGIQLIPTAQLALLSARNFDLPDWQTGSWFLPWFHLIQFVAPDFFGNPATGNYWGAWNYGEFVGYLGSVPLLFAIVALLGRRDLPTRYFGFGLFLSLLLALPTPLAKIPYQLGVPILSTMQPSRIMVLIDFCLVVLAALGFDFILQKNQNHKITKYLFGIGFLFVLFTVLWLSVLFPQNFFNSEFVGNVIVAKRNLVIPTVLFGMTSFSVFLLLKKKSFQNVIIHFLLLVTIADLLRFGWKFTPFNDVSLVYPSTKTISFLQENLGEHRFMATDRRIMPPNVATYYRIQDVSGYDPLYLKNYAGLAASWTRDAPDIGPASFNRIVTPERYDSFFSDLLGVKYILSLKDEDDPKLQLVFQEGQTRVYQNNNAFPRVFLAEEVVVVHSDSRQKVFDQMFANSDSLLSKVFIQESVSIPFQKLQSNESASLISYKGNEITIQADAAVDRLLVLTDVFYPAWKVRVDGEKKNVIEVDGGLRGVVVSPGQHRVEFFL